MAETDKSRGIEGGKPTPEQKGVLPVAPKTNGGSTAAANVEPKTDSEIESLSLADTAKKAAYALKVKYPNTKFLSGRRGTRQEQAHAMAGNIVGNRKWIEGVPYTFSKAKDLQKWVDDHPEKITRADIAAGLQTIMDTWSDQEMGLLSRHFVGEAFDVAPTTDNPKDVKEAMRTLAGCKRFLDTEGGKEIWHVQF